MPRAAFFQSSAAYWGRSFEDGIIRSLLAARCEVEVFAPDGDGAQDLYPPGVHRDAVEYRCRWLTEQIGRRRWRSYDLFIGNPDLGVACAGTLAAVARRPLVCACDEIYAGGYRSPATGLWRRAAHWAMRRAAMTVIPEPEQIPLQREHAGLNGSHPFVVYPCCFSEPYRGPSREEMRHRLGIGASDIALALTAELIESNGADWAFRLLGEAPEKFKLILAPAGRSGAVERAMLEQLAKSGRVIFFPDRVGFRESTERLVAADAALVVYRQAKPQFQRVGISSQRLCTALWVGVPVIVLAQPSFAFVEEFGCGVLIHGSDEVLGALDRICAHRASMVEGARRAVAEYICADKRLLELTDAFERILC